MSDGVMERLCAAMEKNNELLEKVLNGGGATAGAKSTGTKSTATKSTGAKTSTAKKTTTKKATTEAEVAKVVTAYLKTGDKDERAERQGHVMQIVEHYGAERFTLIDPDSFDEALGFLKAFEAGDLEGTPFEGGEEEEEDTSSMV